MITKINKIKDFGIYKDFKWNSLDLFRKKNLIYGWNYSGKTTFSKLFQTLEFRDCDRYFKNSEFIFEIDHQGNNQSIQQDTLENCPLLVKVFNSEYINRIFTWDDPNSNIEPISFYLGDPAGNIKSEIETLEKSIGRLEVVRDNRYNPLIKEFTKYDSNNGAFSTKAKEIREEYLPKTFQTHQLNKSHISTKISIIKDDVESYRLNSKEKGEYRNQALADKNYGQIDIPNNIFEDLPDLTKEVKSILEDSAPKSVPFPELDSDQGLFNWVQTGIELHKNSDNCKFCSQEIPEKRLENLNSYYSEKLTEIQTCIKNAIGQIEIERDKLDIELPNKKELGKNFQEEYQNSLEKFEKKKGEYVAQLDILEQDLNRKKDKIFNVISATKIVNIQLEKELEAITKTIQKHNTWLDNFDERKKTAVDKLVNHYIADFILKENYILKEKNFKNAELKISKINTQIRENKIKIQSLNAQLSTKVKGQEELNESLEILLNRNDIKIKIENGKFTLIRDSHPATNLSEGEKSAIAFSYFLTELKSLSQESKLENTVIFIDDPISSLDSNHIFQVSSLIRVFFSQNNFCQLFISTHSFEFLSVLLDTRLFGRINKTTKEEKRPLYFIQRNNDNQSKIKKLLSAFSSYKSEYVGLFEIIKSFNDLDDKDDFENLIILPNAVRRFVELYTLMKYPSEDEVDRRIKEVFTVEDKPYHNIKLLHWFSHQNQVEKIQQHDDKILQIEGAISNLLNHIENKDPLHWKGLIGQ